MGCTGKKKKLLMKYLPLDMSILVTQLVAIVNVLPLWFIFCVSIYAVASHVAFPSRDSQIPLPSGDNRRHHCPWRHSHNSTPGRRSSAVSHLHCYLPIHHIYVEPESPSFPSRWQNSITLWLFNEWISAALSKIALSDWKIGFPSQDHTLPLPPRWDCFSCFLSVYFHGSVVSASAQVAQKAIHLQGANCLGFSQKANHKPARNHEKPHICQKKG